MRFLDLRLMAYGPFTDIRLDLSGGSHGLHIVYGPNEAGKSASLRAISALLYGIPARSPDNFIHPYPNLRVGATLCHSSGDKQLFIRRKAQKNTLLDENENPLEDITLNRFLSVLDNNLFNQLYGINHETLLQGGIEMKNLKGRIGATLFSAGLGSGVNDLLNKLAEEEKMLAAPRSAQGITRLLTAYKDLRKEVSTLTLAGGEWHDAAKIIRNLQQDIEELNHAVIAQVQERSALERKLRNLPRFAKLAKLQTEISAFGPIITLPESYSPENRQKAVYALEQAVAGKKRTTEQLLAFEGKIKAINLPSAILEHGDKIRQLYRKLDTHQTAAGDRERLNAKRIQKENDAEKALRDLAPELPFPEVEKLRLTRGELVKLRELCVEYNVMHERPQALASEAEQLAQETRVIELELQKLPQSSDPLPLQKALQSVARSATLEQELAETEKRLRTSENEAARGLLQLGFKEQASHDFNSFLNTPCPPPETVDRFDAMFRKQEQEENRITERIAETTDQIERLETEIESFHKSGRQITESEMVDLRSKRDDNWQQIKQNWLDQQPINIPPQALASEYEININQADEASDRLRREAAQVQQLARLEAEHQTAIKRLNHQQAEREKLAALRIQLDKEWREIWAESLVNLGVPQEMRGWLSSRERVVVAAENSIELARQISSTTQAIAKVRQQLVEVLAIYGVAVDDHEPLADLTELAKDRLAKITRIQGDHERLTQTLADRRNLLALKTEKKQQEEAKLAEWRVVWQQAIQKLPLSPDHASPGQVTAVIDKIDTLFDNIGEIDGLNVRIKAIDNNRKLFAQEVAALMTAAGCDMSVDFNDEQAITMLHQQLEDGAKDSEKLAQLQHRQQELEEEAEKHGETIDKAQSYLASLCKEIGCEDYQSMPEIEQRWLAYKRLRDEQKRCEEDIINDGGGLTLAESAKEIEGLDGDQLTAQINSFGDTLNELNRRKEEKNRELFAIEEKQRGMDGNDRAADAAEQATLAGAEVGKSVHRYIRVKLAGALLRRRIEEHRRRSQSPVLNLADNYFKQITLGGFSELATDFEEDQQILIGVRENGDKVRVEAMSDGTRDQLYLALRLAYLDHELSQSDQEPMPIVLDDILMNFDDMRTKATLNILAELSKKTQIIYFTHHQHLLELAKDSGKDELIKLHSLA